mgnify:CR=1 FL=1
MTHMYFFFFRFSNCWKALFKSYTVRHICMLSYATHYKQSKKFSLRCQYQIIQYSHFLLFDFLLQGPVWAACFTPISLNFSYTLKLYLYVCMLMFYMCIMSWKIHCINFSCLEYNGLAIVEKGLQTVVGILENFWAITS